MSADRHPTSRRGGRLPVRGHRVRAAPDRPSRRPRFGSSVRRAQHALYRGEADRLAEHWGVRDEPSVLYQVGALTPEPLPSFAVD